jgi:hypothetical protein
MDCPRKAMATWARFIKRLNKYMIVARSSCKMKLSSETPAAITTVK